MLVGEAYTVPPSDTMPAEPIGEQSPCMSNDAIHEIPSPPNSLGAATAAQSSVVAMSPNDPSADSTNERGIQSSTPDWEMMSLLRCSARSSSRPNWSGCTNGSRAPSDVVTTSRAVPSIDRAALRKPSRWLRRSSEGADASPTSYNDTTVSTPV